MMMAKGMIADYHLTKTTKYSAQDKRRDSDGEGDDCNGFGIRNQAFPFLKKSSAGSLLHKITA